MAPSRMPLYFRSIQYLRAAAAMAVVLYHLAHAEEVYGRGPALLDGIARMGYAGVDVFFVVSGFVMAAIAGTTRGGAVDAGRFLVRRAVRILPLYWLCTSAIVALLLFAPGAVDPSYHHKSVLASYLLLPQAELPLLQVGWTLVYEAYFYLVIALAIAVLPHRRLAVYLVAWAAAILALQFVSADTPWQTLIANPMGWEFIAGALVGLHWRRLPVRLAGGLLIAGLAFGVGAALALTRMELFQEDALRRTLLFGGASVLVAAGVVRLDAAEAVPSLRWLGHLGDASYSMYLTHLFVLTVASRLWGRSGLNDTAWGHVAFIAATVLGCIITALLVHRLIERPLLDLVSRRLPGRPALATVGA